MRTLILLTVILWAFVACGPSENTPAPPPLPAEQRAAIEARLISELSPSDDRAGRERNDIINYAIDQIWDVQPAAEGYFFQILSPGTGEPLMEGDLIALHYEGRFLDGQVFDSSRQRNKKLEFYLGQMIPAWNSGLLRLKPGGKMRLIAPSAQAYGAEGLVNARGDTLVGAHRVLVFEIDALEIKKRALEREW
ncbi:MAG: FKBP-type peptidyl-prolyl cis-trans isomerase [Bacteroidota bacterium]